MARFRRTRRRKTTRRFARRRFKRRRRPRRRKRTDRASMMLIRQPVMTDQLLVKLRYKASITITSTGNYVQHVFRGNSIFDPDESGVGVQPMGHDEYNTLFSSYQVQGCSLSLLGQFNGPDPAAGCRVVVYYSNESQSPATGMFQAQERARSKSRLLPPDPSKQFRIKSYVSSKRALMINSGFSATEQFSGSLFGDNPLQTWRWNIGLASVGSESTTIIFDVHLVYYVRMYNRKTLIRS